MDINLDELREAVKLMRELERIADKIAPTFQLVKSLDNGVVLPVVPDRYIERAKVCEILNIGSASITSLIDKGLLTPVYIADSRNMKFALSEVLNIPKPANRKHK